MRRRRKRLEKQTKQRLGHITAVSGLELEEVYPETLGRLAQKLVRLTN